MLKLTSPSALSKYFSWTTLATSFNTIIDQLLCNSKTSTVIAHLEKVVRCSPVKRPISATIKFYNTFLPNHFMKVSRGGHRPLWHEARPPFLVDTFNKSNEVLVNIKVSGNDRLPCWSGTCVSLSEKGGFIQKLCPFETCVNGNMSDTFQFARTMNNGITYLLKAKTLPWTEQVLSRGSKRLDLAQVSLVESEGDR